MEMQPQQIRSTLERDPNDSVQLSLRTTLLKYRTCLLTFCSDLRYLAVRRSPDLWWNSLENATEMTVRLFIIVFLEDFQVATFPNVLCRCGLGSCIDHERYSCDDY